MLEEKAARIKLLILDVDGVMTDGRVVINDLGQEMKFFNVRDGHGLKLLMKGGVEVAIISGRDSRAVEHRAGELGIREVYQGAEDKESLCLKLMKEKALMRDEVCCVGDDLPDIPMFRCVGLPIAVSDAVPEVRDAAGYVTKERGGEGAVREVCELILRAKGAWPPVNNDFPGKRKIGFT
jgi:3-deoxy-D-manno-octulosonate 8-phosphate phosphatase (KDO 8-P phosphatase)